MVKCHLPVVVWHYFHGNFLVSLFCVVVFELNSFVLVEVACVLAYNNTWFAMAPHQESSFSVLYTINYVSTS